MIYIPKSWLKKPENEKEVRTLISECIGCFHFPGDSDRIESRLKELEEDKILRELKKGSFSS